MKLTPELQKTIDKLSDDYSTKQVSFYHSLCRDEFRAGFRSAVEQLNNAYEKELLEAREKISLLEQDKLQSFESYHRLDDINTELNTKNAVLEMKVDQYQADYEKEYQISAHRGEELSTLRQALEIAEIGLEFYADKGAWGNIEGDNGLLCQLMLRPDYSENLDCGGGTARKHLTKIRELRGSDEFKAGFTAAIEHLTKEHERELKEIREHKQKCIDWYEHKLTAEQERGKKLCEALREAAYLSPVTGGQDHVNQAIAAYEEGK